jgi:hypothetical protein
MEDKVTSPSQILILGSNVLLLETRRLLLQRAGFDVTATRDLHTALALLASDSFEVFILCHSLSPHEVETALTLAHSLPVSTRNLVMTCPLSHRPAAPTDEVLGAFIRPQTLIETVHQLSDPAV